MKSVPRMFAGESYDDYKNRLRADEYSDDEKELDDYATAAWYTRREEMRRGEQS